jgi:imidazolonepropionase-like amidohydrolase
MQDKERRCEIALRLLLALSALVCTGGIRAEAQTTNHPVDSVIRNATVMTVTHGTIEHATVWIHDGKIAGVGTKIQAPPSAVVIDGTGKYLTPGIIDPHSHAALGNDINERTSPITPHMIMSNAFDNRDKTLYFALAGGVTTAMLLHGSTNLIGGQSVVIKNKFGDDRDAMFFLNAPLSIKFAIGENPKRQYGNRNELPATRMGNFELLRQTFEDGRFYMKEWDSYNRKVASGDKTAVPPRKDLKLDVIADILRGKFYVQIHCYRADEFLTEEAIAKEFGFKIRAFHHAVEMYKVAGKIAEDGTAIATWADWWGFKDESADAIPWNAVLSMRKGVRVALKSDSTDDMRHLNVEAGKMVHYGGATEEEALRMITLNPAWIIGIDDRVGSIDVGKDADLVLWNMDPLATFARTEKVFIDGDIYFDRSADGLGAVKFHGTMHSGGFGGGEDDSDDEGDN